MKLTTLNESDVSDEKIASELRGNTLRVYWELLESENGIVRGREIPDFRNL